MKRRVFTLDFKAEVIRHKKAENLSFNQCGEKFDVLPKLIQRWEKQYEAGELTATAGRRTVSPEQAEITRLRAELSRSKMAVAILKKQRHTLRKRWRKVCLYPSGADPVPAIRVLLGLGYHDIGVLRLGKASAVGTRH